MDVFLRRLERKDAYTSYKWRNDPDVFKYTGTIYDHKITLETELQWIERVIKNDDEYRCAIIADKCYVGNIYLTNIDDEKAEYHIFIGDKSYWGKGVAKKASIEIIRYGFDHLNLKKIVLEVRSQNNPAIRLYEKLGFAIVEEKSNFLAMEIGRAKYNELYDKIDNKPLVAIHCLVYNHEPYLHDCFEGFVMQQTNFRFVAIVHDDASTDGSAAIIREYEEKYPHIFKPIYEIENQFSKRDGSLERVMNAAIDAIGAKYVAVCEGDDYWVEPLKLQKQVDFMEANIEYGLCYTDYNRLEDVNQILIESMFEKQNQYRPTSYEQQLLNPGYLAPMTWLYRHELIDIISKANVFTDGTYAYMLEFMYNSKVAYIPEVTAVYRSHVGSASSPIGNKALFRYTVGVFRTQIHYTQKYPCSEECKRKVLMRGYLSKLPIAIMAEQEEFVREAKTFMDAQDMDIDLIIRELKQGEMKRKSYAYRLGKKLLAPFSWIRNKRK